MPAHLRVLLKLRISKMRLLATTLDCLEDIDIDSSFLLPYLNPTREVAVCGQLYVDLSNRLSPPLQSQLIVSFKTSGVGLPSGGLRRSFFRLKAGH